MNDVSKISDFLVRIIVLLRTKFSEKCGLRWIQSCSVNCRAIHALRMSRRVVVEGKVPGGRSDHAANVCRGTRTSKLTNNKVTVVFQLRQIERRKGIRQLPISYTVDGDLLKECVNVTWKMASAPTRCHR